MRALAMLIGWIQSRCARRLQAWIATLLTVGFALGSHAAFAQAISCSGTTETIPVSMPASITVPRDAPNGTVLTPWSRTSSTYYTCTSTDGGTNSVSSGMAFRPLSLVKAGLTVTGPNNVAYTVWNTTVPGIGIAIGVKIKPNGCDETPWTDLGGRIAPSIQPPWVGQVCNSTQGIIRNSGQAEMAFVKTGPVAAGTVAGGVLFEGASVTRQSKSAPPMIATDGRKAFLLPAMDVVAGSCKTPDVTVDLRSHKQSAFTGVGSTTPAIPVKVAINNCPAGLNSIQYQFIPTGAVLDTANGVLALSSDSTATGIGLQLKDESGKALEYNKQYLFSKYNRSTGGSGAILLTAAYYQTSTTVKPGTAIASLTFAMTYQ